MLWMIPWKAENTNPVTAAEGAYCALDPRAIPVQRIQGWIGTGIA